MLPLACCIARCSERGGFSQFSDKIRVFWAGTGMWHAGQARIGWHSVSWWQDPDAEVVAAAGETGEPLFHSAMCSQHGMSLSLSVLLTSLLPRCQTRTGFSRAGKANERTLGLYRAWGGAIQENMFSALTQRGAGSELIRALVSIWLSHDSKVSKSFMH